MGFNIIASYMEFLHLNWDIAEWIGITTRKTCSSMSGFQIAMVAWFSFPDTGHWGLILWLSQILQCLQTAHWLTIREYTDTLLFCPVMQHHFGSILQVFFRTVHTWSPLSSLDHLLAGKNGGGKELEKFVWTYAPMTDILILCGFRTSVCIEIASWCSTMHKLW